MRYTEFGIGTWTEVFMRERYPQLFDYSGMFSSSLVYDFILEDEYPF